MIRLPFGSSKSEPDNGKPGGASSQRFAVFSDVHGNLPALQTCLEDMERQKIKRRYCCGDLVGYGPWPDACCERVLGADIPTVIGNHDQMATTDMDVDSFNPVARLAIVWTRDNVQKRNADTLRELPFVRTEGDFTFVHASPLDPSKWQYILTRGEARVNFEAFDTWICFVGHSHQPFVVEQIPADTDAAPASPGDPEDTWPEGLLQGSGNTEPQLLCPDPSVISLNREHRYLVNVGSVGQPRDRDPRACYVLVDLDAMEIRFVRVDYPVSEAQTAIIDAGLPADLAHRLSIGW